MGRPGRSPGSPPAPDTSAAARPRGCLELPFRQAAGAPDERVRTRCDHRPARRCPARASTRGVGIGRTRRLRPGHGGRRGLRPQRRRPHQSRATRRTRPGAAPARDRHRPARSRHRRPRRQPRPVRSTGRHRQVGARARHPRRGVVPDLLGRLAHHRRGRRHRPRPHPATTPRISLRAVGRRHRPRLGRLPGRYRRLRIRLSAVIHLASNRARCPGRTKETPVRHHTTIYSGLLAAAALLARPGPPAAGGVTRGFGATRSGRSAMHTHHWHDQHPGQLLRRRRPRRARANLNGRLARSGLCVAVLLVPIASAGISPSPALATTTGTPSGLVISSVNAGPGDQNDPHISGSLVTYTSSVNGNSEIRYHDLSTGTDTAIPSAASLDFLSDVSGSTAVITRLTPTASSIASYDTATGGPAVVLDPQPGSNRRDASIGGGTVAWSDLGIVAQSSEIVAYDVGAATSTRLTNDSLLDLEPAVAPDGSVITWTKCTPDQIHCAVWSATRSPAGWTAAQLTPAEGQPRRTDTNGSLVVYDGVVAGDSDIFWQPAGGGVERRLVLPGHQFDASISGDLIAFQSFETTAGVPNWDLMVYDTENDTVYRVTTTLVDETLPDLSVTPDGLVRVVYTAQEGTETNVYAATFNLPRRDRIAFSSTRDGNAEMYAMNADGTGPTRLTTSPGIDTTPAWSPDGARIVFSSTRDGSAERRAGNATGTGGTRLHTQPGIDTTPAWSPDGARIVFSSTRDGNAELYTMNATGTGVTRITTNPGIDTTPAWSPDGTRIVFSSTRDGNAELYTINATGTGSTRLTTNPGTDTTPAWSPDGARIVFSSTRDGNAELSPMNANGPGLTRLTTSPGTDTTPAW